MVAANKATTAFLIDELGKINEQLGPYEALIKRREAITKQLKERVETSASGDKFGIEITTSDTFMILNTPKIKAEMSTEWLDKYQKETSRRSLICFKLLKQRKAARR